MKKSNTKTEKEFFSAIKGLDIDRVRKFVQSDSQLLNAYDYDSFGATPLTLCSFAAAKEMIDQLIQLGADVNRRSDWEMGPWSPLHSAVLAGNDDLARFLLDRGAELDAHGAAGLGLLNELSTLLDENPDRVCEPGGDGCQPLHFAGSIEVAALLIERGADMEARCVDHFSTPVQYLSLVRPEVARYLITKGAKADLFSAVMSGAEDAVADLVNQDPNVVHQRINQETFPPGPVHEVNNILTFTVGHNATPLHAAAVANQVKMVSLMIQKGINPNVRGGYDEATPLHLAAWENHLDIARTLVENGAEVNISSGEIHNNSPAGWAIVAGSADVFEFLMDSGAEVKEFFVADAKAAVQGEFRAYKNSPQEHYERILKKLVGQ